MRNLLKKNAVIVSLLVSSLLAACGGGSGGGNNVGQTYYATCVDGAQRSSKVSASDAVAQCSTASYSATCADNTQRTSAVSVSDAAAQCPVASYAATCADNTQRTSTVSVGDAAAQCPGATYSATCSDNTQRTSTVSASDALAKCPGATYSAICADQTTKTSTTSQAAANALCPIGVVTTVSAPTYKDEKLAALNQLNADRAQCGFGKLQQNAKLDVAAQGHADWIAANPQIGASHVQDPSTGKGIVTGNQPQDRFQNAGYLPTPWVNAIGSYSIGEVIGVPSWGTALSCQYCTNNIDFGNTELSARNGVRSLYAMIYHLAGILAGERDVGFGVSISNLSGTYGSLLIKNVVVDFGTAAGWVRQSIAKDEVLNFPCQGSSTSPVFGGEDPRPFPARGSKDYGQPVYVVGAEGTTVTINAESSSIIPAGGVAVATTIFNSAVDPLAVSDSRRVKSNQVFLVPTDRLLDNTTYTVVINGTNTGMVSTANPTGSFYRTFTFSTVTTTTL